VCAQLVGYNLTSRFNCQAWLDSLLILCYIAVTLNSLIILLRTIAIWERRPIISIALTAVWLTNVAFLIYGITRGESVWIPLENACFVEDSQSAKINLLVSTVTDLILLVSMIIGVLRIKTDSSIWRMLYRHGLLWIVIGTVGVVPPTIFLFLNLNMPMNLMFQTPVLIITTICATRLYRSLVTFGNQTEVFDSFLTTAPMASIQPELRTVRFARNSLNGTSSLGTGTGTTGANASLVAAFPTSYGRYRAEDLELENGRSKSIHEEGKESENVKVEEVC